jgi:aspartate aminotransferase
MRELSQKAKAVKPSVTLALSAQAKQMKAEGKPVIGFGAGEPDFDTPDPIKEVGIEAIRKGDTKYTPERGTLDIRKAIADKFQKDNGLTYSPEKEIIVSGGAKFSVYCTLAALINPGDQVLIPAPYWLSYPEMVGIIGGKSVELKTSKKSGWKIDPEQLKKKIKPKTKVLILNSPSNPAGVVYTKEELQVIADIVVANDLWVISDEIYEKLTYEGSHVSIASLGEEIKKRTIVINGVSKDSAMTGWRIGYAAGSPEVIGAMAAIQSHTTSAPASMCQTAAAAAIRGIALNENKVMFEAFKKRRELIVGLLGKIKGISMIQPNGAFYVFVDVHKTYGKGGITDSLSFCKILLAEKFVSVVPGGPFGQDDFVRFSFATSEANINEGVGRFKEFIASHL